MLENSRMMFGPTEPSEPSPKVPGRTDDIGRTCTIEVEGLGTSSRSPIGSGRFRRRRVENTYDR